MFFFTIASPRMLGDHDYYLCIQTCLYTYMWTGKLHVCERVRVFVHRAECRCLSITSRKPCPLCSAVLAPSHRPEDQLQEEKIAGSHQCLVNARPVCVHGTSEASWALRGISIWIWKYKGTRLLPVLPWTGQHSRSGLYCLEKAKELQLVQKPRKPTHEF